MSDNKIEINGAEILTNHASWAKGEAAAASDAASRRTNIGAYREAKNIHSKAFSQFRAGMKIKKDEDRRDWLRSLQLLLPVAEKEIFGNEEDMLDRAEAAGAADAQTDPENVEQVDFAGAAE